MTDKIQLDVNKLIEVSKNYKNKDLYLCLQSFGKRVDFSHMYYDKFCEVYDEMKFDGGIMIFEDYDVRLSYESYSIAFLQNMHSVCDSIPFLINAISGPMKVKKKTSQCQLLDGECSKIVSEEVVEIEEYKIGWNDYFFDSMKFHHPKAIELLAKLKEFSKDVQFIMLKDFVNQSKHKYLTRIVNNSVSLYYEEFSYTTKNSSGKSTVHNIEKQEVKKFMADCHDEIFPRIFDLYSCLYSSLEKDLM